MTRIAPRAKFRALIIVCGLMAAPAAAQLGGTSKVVHTPAETYNMAPGGVDMRTGIYNYRHTDLSIGGEEESGGLALIRSIVISGHVKPFGNFSHNWDIALSEKRVSVALEQYDNGDGSDFRISVHFGGRSQTFDSSGTGFTQTSKGAYAKLTYSGDRASGTVIYTFTAADGTVAVFRPLGNLDCTEAASSRRTYVSEITEPDGTKFTFDYDYNAAASSNRARLRKVVSSRGYALLLEGSGSLVTKACVLNLTRTVVPANYLCPVSAPATATYAYTSFNGTRLASVTDPGGGLWRYTYAGTSTSFTMGFIKPDQSSPWLTNTLFHASDENPSSYEAVSAQSFADGQSYTYTYDYTPFVTEAPGDFHPQTIAGGQYQDALGQVTNVRYDFPVRPGTGPGSTCTLQPCPPTNVGDGSVVYQQTPGPVLVEDAIGRTTTADYCDPSVPADYGCIVFLLHSFTDPEEIRTELSYDGARNITQTVRHAKPGSGLSDIVTSASYDLTHPKSSNKPLSATDANGNTTNYTYAPEHGGVLTETQPAVNGIRPQKRYTYAQRYAWVSNGAGGYVRASTPIWVLTRMSFCKTGAATSTGCAVAGDEVVTTYEYGPDAGPNNLLLRGTVVDAGGLNLRTCYGYDAFGNKISETKPRAGLAVCP